MKVHVWKRYVGGNPTTSESFCGRRFSEEPAATIYHDLDKATCKDCLKRVRDQAHYKLTLYAPIASAATARLDSLRRKKK